MLVRVLVVDDSRFFRRRVTEMLESDSRIKVIGTAENGSDAIQKSGRLKPDVITMDVEMPVMDGITATKRILATQNIPILMFSSLTTEGAQSTLDALEAGAIDFLPKRFEDISSDKAEAKRLLCERIFTVAREKPVSPVRPRPARHPAGKSGLQKPVTKASVSGTRTQRSPTSNTATSPAVKKGQFKLLAIGTSTGGPIALQKVLTGLPKDFPMPVLLIQHMPGSFTGAFAERLNQTCAIEVKEAADGDVLTNGVALLAPGGKQMTIEKSGARQIVRIRDSTDEQNYKPCVDVTFESVAKLEPAKTLVIILTGMGADGCKGATRLKQSGAVIWAQDEATSVVYGMPGAVAEAGIVTHILPIDEIGPALTGKA